MRNWRPRRTWRSRAACSRLNGGTAVANAARRVAIRLKDGLRYSRIVRRALGSGCVLRDWFVRPVDSQGEARRIVQLCAAARLAADSRLVHRIERRIRARLDRLDPARVDWEEFIPGVSDRRMSKAAVIKPWVSPREKGVIFVSFEDQ